SRPLAAGVRPYRIADQACGKRLPVVLIDEQEAAGQAVVDVVVDGKRTGDAQRDIADLVEAKRVGNFMAKCLDIETEVDAVDDGLEHLGGVLDRDTVTGPQRPIGKLADSGIELADDARLLTRMHDEVAAADIDVISQTHRD